MCELAFRPAGFEVVSAKNDAGVFENIRLVAPALIIYVEGRQAFHSEDTLISQMRSVRSVPIVVLTSNPDTKHRCFLLEMGVEDVMSMPFSPAELVGRIRAILRRQ